MGMEKNENQHSGQAGTSSKDQQRTPKTSDDEHDENASKSESLPSVSSGRSRVETGIRLEADKVPVMKQPKAREEKKRPRKSGRVEKRRPRRRRARRRSITRRARAPKQTLKLTRQISDCSVMTRQSSRSGMRTPACKFCGHRCCFRRLEYELRRDARRNVHRVKKVARRKRRIVKPESIGIQVGSPSMMLSPLFINSNAAPAQAPEESDNCCEVTPEMIYEALRRLTMWRQRVQTEVILKYLKRNYPVNPEEEELKQKLRIAAKAGFVTQVDEEYWSLNCALERRGLEKSHVTKFWQIYADTMKPIGR